MKTEQKQMLDEANEIISAQQNLSHQRDVLLNKYTSQEGVSPAQRLAEILDAKRCIIFHCNKEGGELVPQEPSYNMTSKLQEIAIKSWIGCSVSGAFLTTMHMGTTVKSRGDIIGRVVVFEKQDGSHFTEDDLIILDFFTNAEFRGL